MRRLLLRQILAVFVCCLLPNMIAAAPPKSATFSIVAVDPETGVCGAAVASMYPAVGRVVPYCKAGVGAFCTQHYHVPAWGPRALNLLTEGRSPQGVLDTLLANDQNPGGRQLAIIDMRGQVAQHHPYNAPQESWYWGGQSGRHYAVQGNTLTGRNVITATARAYETTQGSLADRLLAALVAGDCAGGDHRGRLAAGIRVAKPGVEGYCLELYVDRSDDAVIDLHRKYHALKHAAKGQWLPSDAPWRHPCPERTPPKPPANAP